MRLLRDCCVHETLLAFSRKLSETNPADAESLPARTAIHTAH